MFIRDVQVVADKCIVESFKDGFFGTFMLEMWMLRWAYFFHLRSSPISVAEKVPMLVIEMSLAVEPKRLRGGDAAWSVLWPFPFHEYRCAAPATKRIIAADHADQACRWICRYNGWSEAPWKDISNMTKSPGYDWTVVSKKWYGSPDRKYKIALAVTMHLDHFEFKALCQDRLALSAPRPVLLKTFRPLVNVHSLLNIHPKWTSPTVCELQDEQLKLPVRFDIASGVLLEV